MSAQEVQQKLVPKRFDKNWFPRGSVKTGFTSTSIYCKFQWKPNYLICIVEKLKYDCYLYDLSLWRTIRLEEDIYIYL